MVKTLCSRCTKKCTGDVLKVGEKYFHLNCFKCKDCHLNLDTGGFYFRDGDYYCPKDYTLKFSNKCFICSKIIESEIVSALNNHFHRNCFKCSFCCNVFSPGDRVTMKCDQFICNICLPNQAIDANGVKLRELSGRKASDVLLNDDQLPDDVITDQGYISSEPTSFSFPIPKDEDNKKILEVSNQLKRETKSKSSSSRSLFEFGKFYRSSYLDIQQSREKERQSISMISRTQPHKLPENFHLAVPKNRDLKTQSKDTSSMRNVINSANISPITSMSPTSESDISQKENVVRLSSYPAGEKPSYNVQIPLERDDWPAPLSTSILMNEKVIRQKPRIQKPIMSSVNRIPENEVINYTQSLNHLATGPSERLQRNLIEILRGNPINNGDRKLDANVISSSRSPNASIEPLSKPRFLNHKDKSKSRDSSYFNDPDRHMGYSLEFISSTSRPFMAGGVPHEIYRRKIDCTQSNCSSRSKSVCQRDLLSEGSDVSRTFNVNKVGNYTWNTDGRAMSETFNAQIKSNGYDSTLEETLFDYEDELSNSEINLVTGLKIIKKSSFADRIKEQNTISNKSCITSKAESLETLSYRSHRPLPAVKNYVVSYHEIVSRDPKIMKGLDITRLETYLSIEEFQQLFQLNQSDFYRLPEWKRNDLKRRVHLF